MGILVYLLFTCLAFFTIRISEAFINVPQTTCRYPTCPTCYYGSYHHYRYDGRGCQECYCERTTIGILSSSMSSCPYVTCPACDMNHYQTYRTNWRGCQECYCESRNTMPPPNPVTTATSNCPYVSCPACDYYHYQTYRTDWRGCQECYCELSNTSPPANAVPTGSSLNLHPASYWSMSRSSLLSILLNLKQEAQSLLDTAKDTYDHVLHSVIVNDLKKRREAVKEEQNKDQVDNKQA